jgi:oligopeptide transport system permease protein
VNIPPELFQPLRRDIAATPPMARASVSYWQDAVRRFKKSKLALVGLTIVFFLFAAAIFGPMISPYTYRDQDLENGNRPPSWAHPFGTDLLGRDLMTRVLYGARISLSIGIVSSAVALTVGVLYGGVSGLSGGRVDEVMMRIVDIIWGVPLLLVVIMLMVVLSPGLTTIFLTFGMVYWLGMARIVRGQILSLKEREYVLAARTLGASPLRVLLRHLVPNTMGPIIITVTLDVPQAIFLEAFLSYIGLGVSAPMASWGVLASDGVNAIRSYPWQLFFPAVAICMAMLGFNFVGDGLRDALDPHLRR